jgi:hypothetical protein
LKDAIVSSQLFVDLIPDFLYLLGRLDIELASKSFETVFQFGDPSFFGQFCASCVENGGRDVFPLFTSLLLKMDFDGRALDFATELCCHSRMTESSEIPGLVMRLVSVVMSEQFEVRRKAQSALLALFPDGNPEINATDRVTDGELVCETTGFCGRISAGISLPLATAIAEWTPEMPSLSHSVVLFLRALTISHNVSFCASAKLMPYLFAQGSSVSRATGAAIQGLLIHSALIDIRNFLPVLFSQEETPFISSVLSAVLDCDQIHRAVLEGFLRIVMGLTLTSQSAKVFAFLPILTKKRKNTDSGIIVFLILIVSIAALAGSAQHLTPAVANDSLAIINGCFGEVFTDFSVQYTPISRWSSVEDLAQQFSVPFLGLCFADLTSLMEHRSLLELKRPSPVCIVNFVALLMIYIFEKIKRITDPIVAVMAREIAALTISGRDDCCRTITKTLANLWDKHDLGLTGRDGLVDLQTASLRALIRIQEDTQNENLIFLSKVLSVAPPDVIRHDKERLLDTVTRCFEFQTVENLLDAIQAILSCDFNVDEFNNMSVISLPRILTLSVNESPQIRAKANAILRFFAHASDDALIVPGLVNVLGKQEFIILSTFFLDWTSKVELNVFSVALLWKLFEGLGGDAVAAGDFIKKVAPRLLRVLTNGADRLRVPVFELLTSMLA